MCTVHRRLRGAGVTQAQREVLHEAMMRGVPREGAMDLVHAQLSEMATEDLNAIEPLIDGFLQQAYWNGRKDGLDRAIELVRGEHGGEKEACAGKKGQTASTYPSN